MQYSFIYQALLEYYLYGDTELDVSSLEKHLQTSHNAAPNLVKIGLEEEFKVSTKGCWVSKRGSTQAEKTLQKQGECDLKGEGLSKRSSWFDFVLAAESVNGALLNILLCKRLFKAAAVLGPFPICLLFVYRRKKELFFQSGTRCLIR